MKIVGAIGFEPMTSRTRTVRTTGLCHAPYRTKLYHQAFRKQDNCLYAAKKYFQILFFSPYSSQFCKSPLVFACNNLLNPIKKSPTHDHYDQIRTGRRHPDIQR